MESIKIICFIIAMYGTANIIVFGSGPFKIFEGIRYIAFRISPHFGLLFSCMMCLPTNLGIIFSLIDWFFIKNVNFTPFNILLPHSNYMWILASILDGALISGCVWIIHNVENMVEKISYKYESTSEYEGVDSDDKIEINDDISFHRDKK